MTNCTQVCDIVFLINIMITMFFLLPCFEYGDPVNFVRTNF